MTLQIRKHLVYDKHKTLIWVCILKCGKHLLQFVIIRYRTIVLINTIINAPLFEIFVNLIGNHIP